MPVLTGDHPPRRSSGVRARPDARAVRWALVGLLATAAVALVVFAEAWRGLETIASAHVIALLTGDRIDTVASSSVMVVHGAAVTTMLRLTTECSVAYFLGALLAVTAPLALLRRLSLSHTLVAIIAACGVLVAVNVVRLALIGSAVSTAEAGTAFSLTHTYLGSLLTFIGTCVAALVFALVLLHGSRHADASRASEH